MSIASVQADHYSIPLPTVLTDSTHGAMSSFELVTVRLRSGDGAEGVGYTYTVGAGGAAIASLVNRDLGPVLLGAEPDASSGSGSACGGPCTTAGAAASRRWRSRPWTSPCGT